MYRLKLPKLMISFVSLEFFWSLDHQKSLLGHRTQANLIPLSPIQSSSNNNILLRLRGAGIESSPRKDALIENKSVNGFKDLEVTKLDLFPFSLESA